jgi:hypothetical protein
LIAASLNRFPESAEELAALGIRRDIFECLLRELALNFVQFNAFEGGKRGDARDRLLAMLPERQPKDADGADFALYRRSLSFLEERIARVQ